MFDIRPDRPQVIQSTDVYVDPQGIMYMTDDNAGLCILADAGPPLTFAEIAARPVVRYPPTMGSAMSPPYVTSC